MNIYSGISSLSMKGAQLRVRALLRSYKPEKPVFCALPLRAKNPENVFWRACVARLNNLEARF